MIAVACPSCGTENGADAQFCKTCGTKLAATCPNCRAPVDDDARFCSRCGHDLEAEADSGADRLRQYIPPELLAKLDSARAGAAMAGERRRVTMLFCDVQGSTAAAEQLDPEDWAEVINGAFAHLIQPVYRYEGTLARLMGDAILAFFGAPIAHEDDPQRAILAALDIIGGTKPYAMEVCRRWGIDFDVRVGINTGLVVVGEVGSDLRVEYSALGDAVNVAARMEQTAAPGTIHVSESTYRLVAPLFDFEDLGEIEVKGRSVPVRSFRVLREKRDPGSTRGIEGLHSALVGRDEQMAALQGVVEDLQRGRGQLCSVMGEAGMGKSRLVADMKLDLQARGLVAPDGGDADAAPEICWFEGRSFSYERSVPYAPFRSLIADCLGVDAADDTETVYAKLRAKVTAALGDAAGDVVPYLAMLLDVELAGDELEVVRFMEPPVLRERVFGAISTFLSAVARDRPVVVVLEDLHWADSGSMELLERLMPLTDSVMLLVLALFRPRREDSAWQFHEAAAREFAHRYTAIELDALDDDQSRVLVANLLRIEGLPDRVRDLILERAEGNPFFVEEVIRSLLDSGVVVRDGAYWRATEEINDLSVPDTLVSVLSTRLDALDEDAKAIAYTAAVIGREFDHETLAAIAPAGIDLDAALSMLQRRGLVREVRRLPERAYAFHHVLTQQTAYDAALLKTRRQLHLALGERLEAEHPDDVHELARRFLDAGQPRRALPYLVTAGEQSFRGFSVPEAVGYFARAIEVFSEGDDVHLGRRAYEGLGIARQFLNEAPAALQTFDDMRGMGEGRADAPTQASAFNKKAFVSVLMLGDYDTARGALDRARELAEAANDLNGLAEYHVNSCLLHSTAGELDEAREHQQMALEIAPQLPDELAATYHHAFGFAHVARTLVFQTEYEEAEVRAAEALEFVETADQLQFKAELLAQAVPLIQLRNGDLQGALESTSEALELSERIGVPMESAAAAFTAGYVRQLLGRGEEVMAQAEHARLVAGSMGFFMVEIMATGLQSAAAVMLGADPGAVAAYREQVAAVIDRPTAMAGVPWAFADLGFSALALGDVDVAADYFDRGQQVSNSPFRFLMRPWLMAGSAQVHLERGEIEAADERARSAAAFVEERGMRYVEPVTALTTGRVLAAQGRTDESRTVLSRGQEVARALDMRPVLADLDRAVDEL